MGSSKPKTRAAATTPARRSRVRFSIETLLWVLVSALLIYRVTPQVRAAFGFSSGGVTAPAVALDMLDGSSLDLPQLRGRVVLVNFWATWCPPCRFEMPGFEKVYEAKQADGFTIVGLSADEDPRTGVADFLRDHHITYPVGMATPETFAAFGGVNAFPTSFLIDRAGRIRYTVHGIFAEVALREAVDRLLKEQI